MTEKLSTVQKANKLNEVYRVGEPGPGGAYHDYVVVMPFGSQDNEKSFNVCISFQKGPRNVPSSRHGVLDQDLLEIVRDRLRAFQSGEFACRENALALTHIEEALMWMNLRAEDRAERGVLGTYNK